MAASNSIDVSPMNTASSEANVGPSLDNARLYTVFVILGVLTLAAWNFYLTSVGFFELWFPGRHWAFVASMVYQAMNVLGTSLMVKFSHFLPFRPIYIGALSVQMLTLMVMPMLAFWSADMVDGETIVPSNWGFACALLCCAVMGLAESMFTSLVCGLAGSLNNPSLMAGIMTGQGIVGVLSPVLMLSLKFISGDPMKWKYSVVFGFFGCCVAVQLVGIFMVRYVPLAQRAHHKAKATIVDVVRGASSSFVQSEANMEQALTGHARSFGLILKDVLPQLVNVSSTFVITFVVFPGVAAAWAPQLEFFKSRGHLGQDWYTVLVVGIFQVFDVVGRSTHGLLSAIGITARRLWIPVWLRLLFIPTFMLLQRGPDTLPAPWQDYVGFAAMALFAASNGWCSTLAMVHGPQQVHLSAEQHTAGIIMELGLIIGIFAGSVLALLTQFGV